MTAVCDPDSSLAAFIALMTSEQVQDYARQVGGAVLFRHESPQDIQVEDASAMGGDATVGREFSRRFTWATGHPNRPWITVTDYAYCTARTDEGQDMTPSEVEEHRERQLAWTPGDMEDKPDDLWFAWSMVTETIVHSDLDDPGSSEIETDEDRDWYSPTTYSSLALAEQAAMDKIASLNPRDYNPAAWLPQTDA